MTRLNGFLLLLAAALLLVSCGDDGKVTPAPQQRITFTTADATLVEGDSLRLTWTVSGFASAPAVTLSSTSEGVATVANDGWVHAIAPGMAQVVARAGSAADTVAIEVAARPVAIVLTAPAEPVAAGSGEIAIRVRVSDVRDDGVGGVAVDLTPLYEGGTAASSTTADDGVAAFVIPAPTESGEYALVASAPENAAIPPDTASFVVAAAEAASLVIGGPDPLALQVGDTTRLSVTFTDPFGNAATPLPLTWHSTEADVASVNEGLVEATGAGEASILAIGGTLRDSVRAVVTLPPPSNATIAPASATFSALLDTVQFSLTLTTPQGDTVTGQPVTWSVTTAGVASVDAQGRVVSLAAGSTEIVGTSGSLADTAAITVAPEAAELAISPDDALLEAVGATLQLAAAVVDANGQAVAGAVVDWSSLDPAVATVDASGLVSAVANGAARIRAASGAAADTITVSVQQAAASVEVSPENPMLHAVGATAQLAATVADANGQPVPGAPVSWSSLDEGVAAVDANGLVTAVANGTADIVAASGTAADTVTVTVQQAVAAVAISPASAALHSIDETVQLSAAVTDTGGQPVSGASVSWSVLDEGVATVDATGLVTAVANGATQVVATSGSIADTADITVAQTAAAIALTVPVDTMQLEGETQQLTVSYADANGYPVSGVTTTWSSSADSVASVDADGLVTAGAFNGSAWIRAEAGSLADSARIIVRDVAFVLYTDVESDTVFHIQVGMAAGAPAVAYIYSDTDSLLARLAGPTISYTFPAVLDGTVKRVDIKANRAMVRQVEAANDRIVGSFPAGLLTLPNLAVINLALNPGLTGAIPAGIGDLANLAAVELFSTGLSGPLPADFGDLTDMDILNLSDTQLSGSAAVLESLSTLWYLDLGESAFTGAMPDLASYPGLLEVHMDASGLNEYGGGLDALTLVTTVNLADANLSGADVDQVLADLVTSVTANPRAGTVDLGGANAAPSAAGTVSAATLEANGWTVTTAP